MNVGTVVKVYNEVSSEKELCSHGDNHIVPTYEVKRLVIVKVEKKLIPHLNYTSDGYGNVYTAMDAQARVYEKSDDWGGPRATLWRREDNKTFTQYPMKKFSRDLTGRPIKW